MEYSVPKIIFCIISDFVLYYLYGFNYWISLCMVWEYRWIVYTRKAATYVFFQVQDFKDSKEGKLPKWFQLRNFYPHWNLLPHITSHPLFLCLSNTKPFPLNEILWFSMKEITFNSLFLVFPNGNWTHHQS